MATDIDTEISNAKARAFGASLAANAEFEALITSLMESHGVIPAAPATARPTFTAGALVPPVLPDPGDATALVASVDAAVKQFLSDVFPIEEAAKSAALSARAWIKNAMAGIGLSIRGKYTEGLDSGFGALFTGFGKSHPDYICKTVSNRLRDHANRMKTLATSIMNSDMAGDLYEYSLSSGIAWYDRNAALSAVSDYVLASFGTEITAGENATRIEGAKAAMESALAKWYEAQIQQNFTLQADIADAGKAAQVDSMNASALYSDVDARVQTAVQGSQAMLSAMEAARSSVNSVVNAAKVSFG